ncbi:MAG: hypothetical protein JRI70_08010 [Deltaproteobacteria bacterium]|nr:hypothetical protein [Deltaproteobacteria bacterium]
MKNGVHAGCILFLMFIAATIPPSSTWAVDRSALQAYRDGDFASAAQALEEEIAELSRQSSDKAMLRDGELRQKSLLLAHVYAWELTNPDEALRIYLGLLDKIPQEKGAKFIEGPLLVLIGNIYEEKKDYIRAKEYYQRVIAGSTKQIAAERDREVRMIDSGLADFLRYRIDTINLKTEPTGYRPLLAETKWSNLASPYNVWIYSILASILVPSEVMETNLLRARDGDLSACIAQSPGHLPAMLLNYVLILNAAEDKVDAPGEKAITAYVVKYPESYFSLSLLAILYNFYTESGQKEKAAQIQNQLNTYGKRRGMRIVGPDPRFSSPEKTWAVYTQALMAGDVELAMQCHLPSDSEYRPIFNAMGKEKVKQIAEDMQSIERITGEDTRAKYRLKSKEIIKGESVEITHGVYFLKIAGEWKVEKY